MNDDGNHFCAHCGLAFKSECTVCFGVTATYLHCGHALCFGCRSRIERKECPVCKSPVVHLVAASAATELTQLLADLRMFRCDLVSALYYRCTERRFCLYDARHLVAPILEAELWMDKARRLISGWDALVAQAHEDAVATSSLRGNGTFRTRGAGGPGSGPPAPHGLTGAERDMVTDQALFLMSRLKTESLTWPRLAD